MDKRINKAMKDFGFAVPRKTYKDFCPACRKRREHVKVAGMKLCKTCGYQEHINKLRTLR